MSRSSQLHQKLFAQRLGTSAQHILAKNSVRLRGNRQFTIPAPKEYPYQWNWDSGFIAYGYAHQQPERALVELRTLLDGQWANGLLPHIVFHRASTQRFQPYFPGPNFWASKKSSANAPTEVATSGLIQPPMITLALWHVYASLNRRRPTYAKRVLREFYPKLYLLHRYLMTARDPEQTGLVTIFHPWESGFDNSPRWDKPLSRIRPRNIPKYRRRDRTHVNPKFRPSDKSYARFISLALRLKRKDYDDRKIYPLHPFKIKDKVFSSISYLAHRRLFQMATILGDPSADIRRWMRQFEKNIFRYCWNAKTRSFSDYDLITKRQIPSTTIAGLLPLMTGLLSARRVNGMIRALDQANFCGQKACAVPLAPSVGIQQPTFNHELYWRGPIWVNINWFLWRALRLYGFDDRAKHQADHMLQLIHDQGFYEYYSPKTGAGLGARNFSWTAALAIDLLANHPRDRQHL